MVGLDITFAADRRSASVGFGILQTNVRAALDRIVYTPSSEPAARIEDDAGNDAPPATLDPGNP